MDTKKTEDTLLSISDINKIFEQVPKLLCYNTQYNVPKDWKLVNTITDEYYGKEESGREGEKNLIFQLPNVSDYFLKVTFISDSYGYEKESPTKIKFVRGVEKTVTVFEYQ